MKNEDAEVLRLLGYEPENCREIGHTELNRHAVFAAGNEIVKLYGDCDGIDAGAHARAEQKYSALARERGVNAPVTQRIGKVAGRAYTVSERLPGVPVPGDASMEIWHQIGRLLGAFHAPVPLGGGAWLAEWLAYCRTCAETAVKQPCEERDKRAIAAAVELLIAQAQPERFAVLPMGTCHGDFSTRNVLVENDHVTGVIDFELAHEGNVELELACLCRAEFGDQPQRASAFMKGYREAAFLSKEFSSRLPLYLTGEALFSCSWSFEKVPDHFRESVDWLAKFADGNKNIQL
ncbi:MAG: phosphotransferase [Eubacteriales bacterium]|nr:phosphotransferase [Eubacteriales bacterium]